jgi:hypothetical protein
MPAMSSRVSCRGSGSAFGTSRSRRTPTIESYRGLASRRYDRGRPTRQSTARRRCGQRCPTCRSPAASQTRLASSRQSRSIVGWGACRKDLNRVDNLRCESGDETARCRWRDRG